MAFDRLPAPKPLPRRPKQDHVFCVGWHAFVNWPQPVGQEAVPLPMNDGSGKPIANDLSDGQEVEILSWRPRSRDGVTYQIRRLADGAEWWVVGTYLRRQR